MANVKLSQIASAPTAPSLTDTVVGVHGGLIDYQYTLAQIQTSIGASGANPTATAGPAAVNGSATTFMRSDGAPAIQLTSSSLFGLAKVDGTTITASSGVISAVGGGSSPGGSHYDLQYNNGSGGFGGDTATTDGSGNFSLTSLKATAKALNVTGTELIPDGSFATDPTLSGWTLNDNSWSSGQLTVTLADVNTGNPSAQVNVILVAGDWYQVELHMTMTGDTPVIYFDAVSGPSGRNVSLYGYGPILSGPQVYKWPIYCYTSGTYQLNVDFNYYITDGSTRTLTFVSMKQITALTSALSVQNFESNYVINSGPSEYGSNVLWGESAGASVIPGTESVAIGPFALNSTIISRRNIAIGPFSMALSTDASTNFGNVGIGQGTLLQNQGGFNIAIGSEAQYSGTTAGHNVTVGSNAFYQVTTGSYNSGLGDHVGQNVTTGQYNIMLGYGAGGGTLTTGSGNILIGQVDTAAASTSNYLNIGSAIYGQIDGTGPLSLGIVDAGINAFAVQQSGAPTIGNLVAGSWGVFKDTSGGGIVLAYNDAGTIKDVGGGGSPGGSHYDLQYNNGSGGFGGDTATTDGSGNLSNLTSEAGVNASGSNTAASAFNHITGLSTGTAANPAFVIQTGVKTTSGSSLATATNALNVLGENGGIILQQGTTWALPISSPTVDSGGGSILIGSGIQLSTSAAYNSVVIGQNAMSSGSATTNCANHVVIGYYAGYSLAGNTANVLIGYAAGFQSAGNGNIGIGADTCYHSTGSTNVAVGTSALHANTSGSNNFGLGANAFSSCVTGDLNIGLGAGAGQNITSGSNNTIIGALAATAGAQSNTIMIGYGLTLALDFSYTTSGAWTFQVGSSPVIGIQLTAAAGVVVGNAAISTSATDGFLYIPTCAGTPTGTPTTYTGRIAMVYDTTNHQFWFYDSGWKQPKTAGGVALVTWQ